MVSSRPVVAATEIIGRMRGQPSESKFFLPPKKVRTASSSYGSTQSSHARTVLYIDKLSVASEISKDERCVFNGPAKTPKFLDILVRFSASGRRDRTIELEILLSVVVGDLLLGLLGKVRMIPQVLEVLGKLAVPVRNIGGVEKVIVADMLDGLGQESLLGLETKINRRLTYHLAGFLL